MDICYWVDGPLNVCKPSAKCPEEAPKRAEVELARNEYESFQVMLRAPHGFTVTSLAWSGPDGMVADSHFVEYSRFDDGTVWGDALSNAASCAVEAECTQSVWVNLYAPAGMAAGKHQGCLHISTNAGEIEVPVDIRVYGVTLPPPQQGAFSVEYWMNLPGFWWRSPPEEQERDFIKAQYGATKYSTQWWHIAEAFAVLMNRNRCNVLYVRTQDLLAAGDTKRDEAGRWHFDWTVFDRYISLFLEKGGIKLLAGFHIIQQTEAQFVHTVDKDEAGEACIVDRPIDSEDAKAWLDQMLPALWKHLQEKGWDGIWLQHIEDEPEKAGPWAFGRAYIRRHMPGVRCLDAIDQQAPMTGLQGEIDLWVPRVDIYEDNPEFYDYRQVLGEERWTYTCCVPNTPNYLNKFIGWPVFQNRILGWGCFSRGFTGFLHWGFNYWNPDDIWFGMSPHAMFKGDGYIVYPDPDSMGLKESVRMAATRDAAEDYELLHMLAQHDAKAAYTLARQMVRSFHDFEWKQDKILELRSTLLQKLEGYEQ